MNLKEKFDRVFEQISSSYKILIKVNGLYGLFLIFFFIPISKIKYLAPCIYHLKHWLIIRILYRHLNDLISKHKNDPVYPKQPQQSSEYDDSIWVYWNDENNIPPLVKRCIAQISKYAAGRTVRLVTENNLKKYISLSSHVEQKYTTGKITRTHFSDIVRLSLMSKYGGIYMDATLLQTDFLEKEWLEHDFFTIKAKIGKKYKVVSEGKWSSFFFACRKNNLLTQLTLEMMNKYWEKWDLLIDYLWIDYLWMVCSENIPSINQMFEEVPYTNAYIYTLNGYGKACSDEEYKQRVKKPNTVLYKMSYKGTSSHKEMNDIGEVTFLGRIINSEI